ncbi:MAG TPA: CaiB/BaiF CoA-transferase family protein [Acetobacteraceae bacterium]|jgi:crotonobetainyl-CoA:carnitine CoA-transferase CaiB-like acyl-CoA transferase|nr:CaiB/BaiF CoA-transferase family protein [Acetobacteraceae bacterium]
MPPAPLAGLKVVEFVHMVMGPTAGLVLADLGADVIKVEPRPDGDNTRRLTGSGAGFFIMFNRNKRSLAVDLKRPEGMELVRKLLVGADVLIENFRPGAMEKLGLGHEALAAFNPRLIYCSCKGFLPGPYDHRTALDEVVQMMGGLAYMTGLPGRPLRAGTSVNDIMGGMFGVIAILAALHEREATGRGRHVQTALFENTALLMGQHMAQIAVTGREPAPMSQRSPAWPVYDIFETDDGGQIFVGAVTDGQWHVLCKAFALDDLLADPSLATQAARVAERARTLPRIAAAFRCYTRAGLTRRCEELGLPFAPIGKPADLFKDPHLNASGGLLDIKLADGTQTKLPALPIAIDGKHCGLRRDPPRAGEHDTEIARDLGLGEAEIVALRLSGIIL